MTEHGVAVTTAQIARAAGIGEATIFRVFEDKDAVLQACITAATDSTVVLQELQSIPLDQPLPARLVEAADALDAYFDRMGAVIGTVHAARAGKRRPHSASGTAEAPLERRFSRDAAQAATPQAISELFEPDQASLRLPPADVAEAFLALFFSRGRRGSLESTSTEQLVDLFLYGALHTQEA